MRYRVLAVLLGAMMVVSVALSGGRDCSCCAKAGCLDCGPQLSEAFRAKYGDVELTEAMKELLAEELCGPREVACDCLESHSR